jgi:hypothetical protein
MKASFLTLATFLVILAQTSLAGAASGMGTVVIQIQGYGTVHGQLLNATVEADNGIAMSMSVKDQLQTQLGLLPLQATGEWSGVLNNSTISGMIHDVQGSINVCVLFSCNDVDFSGYGNWTGKMQTNSSGSGTFTGTITVTNSPYPQISQGQTIPIFGTWSATFAAGVSEFNSSLSVMLLAISTAALTLARRRTR